MSDPLSLPSSPPSDKMSRRGLWVLGILVLCAAAAAVYWRYTSMLVSSQSARVEGQVLSVTAAFSGRIASVPVGEGEAVKEGRLLLSMDDGPLRLALTEAQAALRIAEKGGVPAVTASPEERMEEQNAIRQAESLRVEEQKTRQVLEHWTAEHARAMISLRASGASARPNWNSVVAEESRTRANVEAARQAADDVSRRRAQADGVIARLRQAGSSVQPGPELAALWRARVAQAQAAVAEANIIAPTDGRVIRLNAREGQTVSKGDDLLLFVPVGEQGSLWVSAVFDPSAMGRLRVGQACRIQFEDGPALEGVVSALIPTPDNRGGVARIEWENREAAVYPGQNARVTVRMES